MILFMISMINENLFFKIYHFISKRYKKLVNTFPSIPKFFSKLLVLCMFFVGICCLYFGISDLFRVGEFGEVRTVSYVWGGRIPKIGDVVYEMRTFGSSFWDWFRMIILIGGGLYSCWISLNVIYYEYFFKD